jgi:hypothetical protein
MIPDAPPDADKGWPRIPVPPLREFFGTAKNAKFWVFWEENAVVVVYVSHR